jgi:hypothetical protein
MGSGQSHEVWGPISGFCKDACLRFQHRGLCPRGALGLQLVSVEHDLPAVKPMRALKRQTSTLRPSIMLRNHISASRVCCGAAIIVCAALAPDVALYYVGCGTQGGTRAPAVGRWPMAIHETDHCQTLNVCHGIICDVMMIFLVPRLIIPSCYMYITRAKACSYRPTACLKLLLRCS